MFNDYIRIKAFYNSLTWVDAKGNAIPALADSFESDESGTEWVFSLRKDVVFHDGSDLTAADVVYSFARHKKVPSVARPLVDGIEDIRADGPYKVIFKLVEPDVDFPLVASSFQFAIIKEGTTDFSNPIGTGPFKVKEFRAGLRTSGVRNGDYFISEKPYLDGFELISVLEVEARANALLT